MIPAGKVPTELLRRLLAMAASDPGVTLGPGIGEDAAALELPAGTLVVAADPVTFAGASAARSAVLVNANDVAVTGACPRWFLATVLLPEGTGEEEAVALFADLHRGLAEVGAVLVGGHTEVTSAVVRPVVAGQMLGLAEHGAVATGGLHEGDHVLQVGPAPVEGAGVLASAMADRLRALPADLVATAARAGDDPGISVVAPALLAAELGATAMHDPTEGGLASALHELAAAAGVGLRVDRDAVRWFEPGIAVCRALGADPWATLASGALLAAFPPASVEAALIRLRAQGLEVSRIAVATHGGDVVDTAGAPLPWPERDEVARLLAT